MLQRFLIALTALMFSGGALAATQIKPPAVAAPATAVETASGMRYVVLKAAPDPGRAASGPYVDYRADIWTSDGVTRFNANDDNTRAVAIRALGQTLPGLARAILTTPIGETRRWWIEPDALGRGYPGMPALTHIVDLTVIGNGADPAPAPADVRAVPADAVITASGLAYRALEKGAGGGRPTLDSTIQIHYSGWTTDGKLFDSSVVRGEPASFPLSGLIRGWQEGMQLMSPGDRYRFWVPGYLAYDGVQQAGTPKGMLVFDVTLIGFKP